MPASMRSVFSSRPTLEANCRTERGLRIATPRPCWLSRVKDFRSYPPVASIAISVTQLSRQNAASASMPAGSLEKLPVAPSVPMDASRMVEEISTPQISCATVTFLVCATGCHATVRSYVTWDALPGLSDGGLPPQDEREARARGRERHSSAVLFHHYIFIQKSSCRKDTRMTSLI